MATARTQFRPRPIDVTKSIPVIHDEIPEDECTTRYVPVLPTGMEKEEEKVSAVLRCVCLTADLGGSH